MFLLLNFSPKRSSKNEHLERAGTIYYNHLNHLPTQIIPDCLQADSHGNFKSNSSCRWSPSQLCPLLGLGQKLNVDVRIWLK